MCYFVSRANDLVHHAEMDLKEKRRGGEKKRKKKRDSTSENVCSDSLSAKKNGKRRFGYVTGCQNKMTSIWLEIK